MKLILEKSSGIGFKGIAFFNGLQIPDKPITEKPATTKTNLLNTGITNTYGVASSTAKDFKPPTTKSGLLRIEGSLYRVMHIPNDVEDTYLIWVEFKEMSPALGISNPIHKEDNIDISDYDPKPLFNYYLIESDFQKLAYRKQHEIGFAAQDKVYLIKEEIKKEPEDEVFW